jgi:hypothetical protein
MRNSMVASATRRAPLGFGGAPSGCLGGLSSFSKTSSMVGWIPLVGCWMRRYALPPDERKGRTRVGARESLRAEGTQMKRQRSRLPRCV